MQRAKANYQGYWIKKDLNKIKPWSTEAPPGCHSQLCQGVHTPGLPAGPKGEDLPCQFPSTSFFFFLFGCTHSMWKFPGLGLNLSHSNNLSCSSDITRSLTCWATRELLPCTSEDPLPSPASAVHRCWEPAFLCLCRLWTLLSYSRPGL